MNLAGMIESHAGAAVALLGHDEVVTYGELRERVAVLRSRLHAAGVAPDDRVALVAANHPAFVVGYLAILGAGAVAVPLNPASPGPELQREVTAVGAEVVVAGPGGLDAVGRCEGAFRQVLAADAPAEPGLAECPMVDRGADDLALLMFTAGTAGSPKAARITHGNLLANLDQMQRHPGQAVEAADVCLGVLPLFHIYGLNVVLGLALHHGASVVLLDHFDAPATVEALVRHRVTLLAGVPTMYAALAALPTEVAGPGSFASVRLATSGAAPLPGEVASAFTERTGVVLHQGYGLTEASPVVTASLLDQPARWGSIGVPLPGVEVRLVDPEGVDALVGDPGEVWVRGPNVFGGYWEDAEATRSALTPEGWLRTGDVAMADDEGELYLVDRAKDLIIVSGFNVYPAEVEEVLLSVPAVGAAAVVGRAHEQTGETVTAYVVAADGHAPPEPAELMAECRRMLARYKCPTVITVVPSLPYGLGGKLLRRALKGKPPAEGW
jgi:long-chain acyl-CoA synthetase